MWYNLKEYNLYDNHNNTVTYTHVKPTNVPVKPCSKASNTISPRLLARSLYIWSVSTVKWTHKHDKHIINQHYSLEVGEQMSANYTINVWALWEVSNYTIYFGWKHTVYPIVRCRTGLLPFLATTTSTSKQKKWIQMHLPWMHRQQRPP